jgi:hypothetical protein
VVRLLVAGFLLAHGGVHAAIYATPREPTKPAPFDPARSWALATAHVRIAPMRVASARLAWVVTIAYGAAGVAVAFDAPAWAPMAAVAAVGAVVFKALWFNRWLTLGVALDLAVLAALAAGWPRSLA